MKFYKYPGWAKFKQFLLDHMSKNGGSFNVGPEFAEKNEIKPGYYERQDDEISYRETPPSADEIIDGLLELSKFDIPGDVRQRIEDTVGRFGYHHVYAICRIHRPEDLELIASRLHRNASHRGSGADGHEVYIGGIAFPSAESFDSDHMLQMALLRLDVARRSDSGIDILACDDSQEQIRRYHVSHTDDRVPSSPHLHEGPGTGPQRRSR